MIVRYANEMDAIAIGALIEDYYARRNAEPQFRKMGTWYVAQDEIGAIHAAQNRADTGTGDRWILDTYCFDSRAGKVGLSLLLTNAYAEADRDGVALLGVSEMDNVSMANVVQKHGWTDVGVLRRRAPQVKEVV